MKKITLGIIAYTIVTFTIAILWHIVLFEQKYKEFGYIESEPNFLLGLMAIFIQGSVLSFLFPYTSFAGSGIIKGLKYSLLIGVFFWTSHVLAFVAKQDVNNSLTFIFMESFYLLLQFGIFGLLIGLIYKKDI